MLDAFSFSTFGDGFLIFTSTIILTFLSLLPKLLIESYDQLSLLQELLLKTTCAILISLMFISLRIMGKNLRSGKETIQDLIICKNKEGFIFWYNYLLARFSGVDLKADKSIKNSFIKKRHIHITQSDVMGGIPSLLIFLVFWIFGTSSYKDGSFFICFGDFIYWALIAYITGMIGQVSINFSLSITENLSLLPMKLTPLNNFSNIRPIRNIIKSSIGAYIAIALLPILFVTVKFIFPSQVELVTGLLIPWFFTSFAFMLLMLVIVNKSFIIFFLIYILFSLFLINSSGISSSPLGENIYLSFFGIYWTALLIYQIRHAFSPMQEVLENKKRRFLQSLDKSLGELTESINNNPTNNHKITNEIVDEIEKILKIRDIALKAKTSVLNFKTVLQAMSPVLSSLLIPLVLDTISNFISDYIIM